jgi:hypothetical protein
VGSRPVKGRKKIFLRTKSQIGEEAGLDIKKHVTNAEV